MIPAYLQTKLVNTYGRNLTADITSSYSKNRFTALRVNTIKTNSDDIKNQLNHQHIPYETVPYNDFAIILPHTNVRQLIDLDMYKEGHIYVQSLSSQLPPLFLNPQSGEQILDMTASPGGKTTEIASLSQNKALITAIEKNKIRVSRLTYNIEKLGAKKVTILNKDARHLDDFFLFDKILLDAPCSGSGTLSTETLSNFTEELVTRSIKTQQSLLKEAIKHLRVGGILIYSTCSILKEENENNIQYILEQYPEMELVPLDLTLYDSIPTLPVTLSGTLCVKPTIYYEGFFIAKLVKTK